MDIFRRVLTGVMEYPFGCFFDCPKMKKIKKQYKLSKMEVYCSKLSQNIVNTEKTDIFYQANEF